MLYTNYEKNQGLKNYINIISFIFNRHENQCSNILNLNLYHTTSNYTGVSQKSAQIKMVYKIDNILLKKNQQYQDRKKSDFICCPLNIFSIYNSKFGHSSQTIWST